MSYKSWKTTPLCELALRYRTDKFLRHYYTPVYFTEIADPLSVRRVLELGVLQGHSLRMWRDFFPNAQITGLDNDPKTIFAEERITCYLCDQADTATLKKIVGKATARGKFDLIVDDTSHLPELQALNARILLAYLADGGLYSIEDVKRQEGKDDPTNIIGHLPPGFDVRLFRTGGKSDDAMILIRKKVVDG